MTTERRSKKKLREPSEDKGPVHSLDFDEFSKTHPAIPIAEAEDTAHQNVLLALLMQRGGLTDMSTERMLEIEKVTSLLRKDISKELTILNLINERGLITADEIEAAMTEAEKHAKPLWEGSL